MVQPLFDVLLVRNELRKRQTMRSRYAGCASRWEPEEASLASFGSEFSRDAVFRSESDGRLAGTGRRYY